jgi:LytS/YehU family sensor histidine kinase
MLRYTVEAGSRSAALLADEIAFVEDYLGVARERYEGELGFTYRGPRELLSATVPPLLLQPLVENSLKHGLAPGAKGLCLTLDAERADGWLTVTFNDDGTAGGNGARGLGVGLENLEARVRRFAGEEASMEAGPRASGGYAVTLRWREAAEVRR